MKESRSIHLDKLKQNPFNRKSMRKEVYEWTKNNISKKLGMNVEPFEDYIEIMPLGNGYYEIEDGNHRIQMLKELGLKVLPKSEKIRIQEKTLTEDERDLSQWIKSQSGSQHPIKVALGFARQKEKGLTNYQIANRYGLKQSTVRNYLRLLSGLHPKIIEDVKQNVRTANISHRGYAELVKYKEYPQIQYALYKKLCNGEQFSISKYTYENTKLICELVKKYKISTKELSKFYKVSIKQMKRVINNALGVQPIPIEEVERLIKERKEKEKKKEREEMAQTTLDVAEISERTKKRLEAIKEKIKGLTPNKRKVLDDITKRKHYENLSLANTELLVDFINNASFEHMEELSNLIKDKQYPNITYRTKIVKDTENKVATVTLPKSLYEDVKRYCDLEKYSLNDLITFSLIRILENKKS